MFKNLNLSLNLKPFSKIIQYFRKYSFRTLIIILTLISVFSFVFYWKNGEGLAYNDARSHLDIGRRVVENLKPGLAQLGSVWLPLPHILMIPTVWNDFFWHSGLSGALQSMIAFVITGILILLYLKKLQVGFFGRLFAVTVFVLNLNILYLTSTAMTELLLMATMTAGSYYLLLWYKDKKLIDIVKSAFWTMISTTVRYDGWFLLLFSTLIVAYTTFKEKKVKFAKVEGMTILFSSLAAFGVILWFLWNILIFGDPLYFIFGPYSAHAQQEQIYAAGELATKWNLPLSVKTYTYALFYNSYTVVALFGLLGLVYFLRSKNYPKEIKAAVTTLLAPFFFNVLALYLGHSVLFVQGIVGETWFNVRYGVMLMPAIAVFIGYLVDKVKSLRFPVVITFCLVMFFAATGRDVVTIDDALIGASGKNVAEVSGWLSQNAKDQKGFILISAASHDAIIFSSGLPIKRFIHEGTGKYWEEATGNPDQWATWIIMRTNDISDLTFREVEDKPGFKNFELVGHYPFADIYELKPEYRSKVTTEQIIKKP
jgi:hypothetical protein